MDIARIISTSIDKAVKDVVSDKISTYPIGNDEQIAFLAQSDALLMNYSNILITTYHEELKKALAEQNITI